MHAAMGASQHPLGLVQARIASGSPTSALHALEGTTHPPDTTQYQQKDQQIAHDGKPAASENKTASLPRTTLATPSRIGFQRSVCSRSQAAVSVLSFLAKQKRITPSSRPSAKNADTGIAATPTSRVNHSQNASSDRSEIAS